MISEEEVPVYLEQALPAISQDFTKDKQNPYDAMSSLIEFTCRNIKSHNYRIVKNCFQIAEKLNSKGNSIVKNAVQNVFVYSFTRIFQAYPAEKQELIEILPLSLYSLYVSQIYHRGC